SVAAIRHARGSRAVGLCPAVRRATVVRQAIAIVAALRALFHAIAAGGRRAYVGGAVVALVVVFQLAELVAAVPRCDVTIVAALARRGKAIAADSQKPAWLPGRVTGVAFLDHQAVRAAAVATHGISVVASFVGSQLEIAAARGCLGALVAAAHTRATGAVHHEPTSRRGVDRAIVALAAAAAAGPETIATCRVARRATSCRRCQEHGCDC